MANNPNKPQDGKFVPKTPGELISANTTNDCDTPFKKSLDAAVADHTRASEAASKNHVQNIKDYNDRELPLRIGCEGLRLLSPPPCIDASFRVVDCSVNFHRATLGEIDRVVSTCLNDLQIARVAWDSTETARYDKELKRIEDSYDAAIEAAEKALNACCQKSPKAAGCGNATTQQ